MSYITRQHKNKLLLVSTVDDTFFSPSSRRYIPHKSELSSKIAGHIKTHMDKYYGVVNLAFPTAHYKDINPFESVPKSRLVNIVLNSNSLLNVSNELALPTQTGPKLFNGNDFDFILPSKDFEIHIVGVDVNGYFKNVIKELLDRDYKVFVYSNMIKRFTATEEIIKGIHNKNFEYCSAAAALT